MYINLDQAKKHLNVDSDYTDDDNYIESLINSCEDAVEKHINIKFEDIEIDGGLPYALQHAILLLIENYYANRESVAFASANKIPNSYDYLLDLFKKY
ncbi:MAG: head-tail connector protein [Bacteroidales bacterium]|jgi:uncharacterized phage protein (predicted DNA packaging)|nr:head-tail connector protein [Bacteroidales bacterium]